MAILKRVPRYPRWISVAELKRAMDDDGYAVDAHTIQRDLIKLSEKFPLTDHQEGRKNL